MIKLLLLEVFSTSDLPVGLTSSSTMICSEITSQCYVFSATTLLNDIQLILVSFTGFLGGGFDSGNAWIHLFHITSQELLLYSGAKRTHDDARRSKAREI